MECCYPVDCGEYAVAPMLVPAYCPRKYCDQEPCCPRLPRCQKPKYYCSEKPCRVPVYDCCAAPPQKGCCSPSLPRRAPCPEPEPCCYEQPCCKPVKTKYIMPCYRYEDGRIANQPTVLMRRACEVACGTRKRKPFVVSSYAADPHNEIRRFHSEDERGNCCFHFERKKPPKCDPCWAPGACQPCVPCHSSPVCCPTQCLECQYVDGVYAHPTDPTSCCQFS
ncbi:hypothetical protein PYW08_006918 [Mythimna loreyi]|uniref:Uncharacterized protein n=1 Tax=Mythimna loreyi TaxID=667449 RepID=A0ACC2RBL2_9NEOP|nr:hypothetical protein PYW08_006918 [Mythimna loreyi]